MCFFRKDIYCKGYSLKTMNENTLIKDGIAFFLWNYFPNTNQYTSHGAEKSIKESKRIFSEIDPSLKANVRRGDLYSIITKGQIVLSSFWRRNLKDIKLKVWMIY